MAGMSTERLEYLRKANKTSILAHKVVLELFAEIDAIRADLAAAHETFASTPWGTCHTCKAPLTQATAYRCRGSVAAVGILGRSICGSTCRL